MGLFDQALLEPNVLGYGEIMANELQKALTAGYGTDSASMTGGRSLIPQDIENTLVQALTFSQNDFKLFNLLKTEKVGSTIHEYTRRSDVGDYSSVFVAEGGTSVETSQTLQRITRAMKYLQTYRVITMQMRAAKTLENAEASEQIAGTLVVLEGAEWSCFHGHSASCTYQFDGFATQIRAETSRQNISDLRGARISAANGDAAITDIARMVYENGGNLTHSFMPPIIARDMQDLAKDRIRFNTGDDRGTTVIEKYPTPFSDEILIAGKAAGPDKFYRVKAKPVSSTNAARPDAVTFALLAQAKTQGTGFTTIPPTAGTYYYQVYAIDANGLISDPATAASAAPTNGQQVRITITPGTKHGTGYIVCRSKIGAADGTDCREMFRVADSGAGTTVTIDSNDELPGTGEILFVSNNVLQPSFQWDQFLPLMKFDLYPSNAAIVPFLIMLYGALDVKTPWYNGLIKNVGYAGDWYN